MKCQSCGLDLVKVMWEVNGVTYYIYFCEYCVKVSQVIRIMNN